ncbi:hypothetical protein GCM10025778_01370 [Paeniglutamicibacter antarcticus]|uniref:Uncharacterized protein n=2 Tax=Paeniglutamicibacter antarcticus TaxID=494023 RepID=A0ABP9TIJ2_9MICC
MKDSRAKTLEHHCGVASSPKAAQPAAPKTSVAKVQLTGGGNPVSGSMHTGKTGWMSSKYLR